MLAAARAYGTMAKAGLSARQIEAAVARQCAGDLARAADTCNNDTIPLLRALDANIRFWAELAAGARRADSGLPGDVRDNIGQIADFVFARTHRVAENPAPEPVRALVDINLLLAAGLEGQTPQT